ncbi:hypothetical protein P7K49_031272 [Saguinus oedipus]|uniref:Cdc42 binding domain-containing protein n=1 Tax=Saguinus oedipus TaxID=9490 RepID=A0ABQ9TYY0_SAGOE|nr:hypothetical protein P7K49_031272 [Saguinus oedipus]
MRRLGRRSSPTSLYLPKDRVLSGLTFVSGMDCWSPTAADKPHQLTGLWVWVLRHRHLLHPLSSACLHFRGGLLHTLALGRVKRVAGRACSVVPHAAENYWWRGQNTRTLCVGPFPRNVVTSVAGLSAQDISQPLQNSFIHTGHGDSDPRHCWGFPDRIDE